MLQNRIAVQWLVSIVLCNRFDKRDLLFFTVLKLQRSFRTHIDWYSFLGLKSKVTLSDHILYISMKVPVICDITVLSMRSHSGLNVL